MDNRMPVGEQSGPQRKRRVWGPSQPMGPGSLLLSRRSDERDTVGRTTSVAITGKVEPTGEFLW